LLNTIIITSGYVSRDLLGGTVIETFSKSFLVLLDQVKIFLLSF